MKKPLLFFKKCKVNNSDSMVFKDLWLIVHAQEIVFLAAEKSIELDCLKDLLRGEVEPSIGHAYVYNEKIDLEKAGEWLSEHIYCFSKEETIISNISVVDNFFICRSGKQPWFARDKKNKIKLREILKRYHLSIDLDKGAEFLSEIEKYELLLLRAIYNYPSKILLIDIRDIFLSDEEFLVLIQFIQQLKENGATIILIGYYHFTLASKVDSLALISDQMTLLQRDRSFFDITDLQIIGRMQLKYTDSEDRTETALKVQGLESQFLQDVRFSAHSKEITNIYYSKHSAALELYNVISGKEQEYDGELYLSGRMLVSKTVYDRVKEGIFGIAECGRPEEFLLDNLSAWQNYVLLKGSSLREVWWKKRYQTYLSEEMDREIGRKITDKYPWEMTAWEASSIRLMAFMLARPKVLICLDPYSGVDKVTSERINKWLIRIAEKGAAVIVISRQQNLSGINYYLTEKGTMVRVKNS